MPNYESMTLTELDKKFLELRKKRVEIKEEQAKINAVREKMIAELKVKKKIEAMSDKEKKIATQMLSTKSIISEEKVGTPGTK